MITWNVQLATELRGPEHRGGFTYKMGLAENLQNVRGEGRPGPDTEAGGPPREMLLVAVTKTVGPEEVRGLTALTGVIEIGENRVQDALRKQEALGDGGRLFRWRMIGTLQRNKVRRVVENFAFIHSLDRLEVVEGINKREFKKGKKDPVLIQVNVAGEETKHGLAPEELLDFYGEIRTCPGLACKGCDHGAAGPPGRKRDWPVFARLQELHQEVARRFSAGKGLCNICPWG